MYIVLKKKATTHTTNNKIANVHSTKEESDNVRNQ